MSRYARFNRQMRCAPGAARAPSVCDGGCAVAEAVLDEIRAVIYPGSAPSISRCYAMHIRENQLILPNLDVDVVADEEVGLFEPMAFEKDEWNLDTRLVTYPVGAEAVVVSRSTIDSKSRAKRNRKLSGCAALAK